MRDIAVRLTNVGKQYQLGQRGTNGTLREMIWQSLSGLAGRSSTAGRATAPHPFWALRDVSLDVAPGTVLGVIGDNGAGKSTLLKILSRITEPTTGRVELRGRVGSLLEVGTGFHPELTGRENVFLNGAILGMSQSEISRKFDEIVAFADIGGFVDTPVKRYSSGMYVRLAFAVAAHLDSEILVVDEVLAVGDARFQAKCVGKMQDVARREGRTILFVSHNMQAVKALCGTSVLFERGAITAAGQTSEVVRTYLAGLFHSTDLRDRVWHRDDPAAGNGVVRLRRGSLAVANGSAASLIRTSDSLKIEIDYSRVPSGDELFLGIVVYTDDGAPAFESYVAVGGSFGTNLAEWECRSTCTIPGDLLNEGGYRVRIQFVDASSEPVLNQNDALRFTVHDDERRAMSWYGRFYGPVRPKLHWTTERRMESPVGHDA
jgi:lipopolysaccharide transport system ATP-binding protein